MSHYTELLPYPGDEAINTNVSPLHQSTVLAIFGEPAERTPAVLHGDETPVTNPKLKSHIVTESVGPFKVTGHRKAVEDLRVILSEVKVAKPELYKVLGQDGMLVCRLVRGSTTSWSNHSFGFAVDFLIDGKLDKRGDGRVMRGLLELYDFFHRHGWFWGAEFGNEDAMHFEAGDALVRNWHKAHLLV